MSIALAIAVVTIIGIAGAAILVVAAKFMAVEEDERIGLVTAEMPRLSSKMAHRLTNACRAAKKLPTLLQLLWV